MRKDTHLYIEVELAKQIEKIAIKENIKISDVYNRLLGYGLKYDDICRQMSLVANMVEKINSNINYNKKLLQQVYADLNLNQIDPRASTNLVQFNNNYRKTRKSLND